MTHSNNSKAGKTGMTHSNNSKAGFYTNFHSQEQSVLANSLKDVESGTNANKGKDQNKIKLSCPMTQGSAMAVSRDNYCDRKIRL